MKKAYYHQHGGAPLLLFVVALHANGTVDLAREEKGEPIISECPVVDEPTPGHCTPFEADKPVKVKDPVKEARAAAIKAQKAAEKAELAASEKPDNEGFQEAAANARAEADKLDAAAAELEKGKPSAEG
jgi:hypothetical protein